MNFGLVVIFWDPVSLDGNGELVSVASFVRVLEEIRRLTPVLLFCGGNGEICSGHNIRIVPVGIHPAFATFVRRPSKFVGKIQRAIRSEMAALPLDTPVLLVDAILASRAAMPALKNRRVFLYVRGDDVREARVRHRGYKWLAGVAHALVLMSVRRSLLAQLPVIGAGKRPLPGRSLDGKDVWPFYPSTIVGTIPAPADTHPTMEATPRIVWVGRMTPIKRVDRLIGAASRFASHFERTVQLDLYGDGPLRGELERQANTADGRLKTVFHGQTPNTEIIGALRGALCMALTSEWEGFPKVVPEAMSAGLPVVTFDVGSVSALIKDAGAGLVVSDETKMAEAFEAFSGSPERWRECSANARGAVSRLGLDVQCRALLRHMGAIHARQ